MAIETSRSVMSYQYRGRHFSICFGKIIIDYKKTVTFANLCYNLAFFFFIAALNKLHLVWIESVLNGRGQQLERHISFCSLLNTVTMTGLSKEGLFVLTRAEWALTEFQNKCNVVSYTLKMYFSILV